MVSNDTYANILESIAKGCILSSTIIATCKFYLDAKNNTGDITKNSMLLLIGSVGLAFMYK